MAPPPRHSRRCLPVFALLIALAATTSGCATVSSLNSSARALDTYALNPLPAPAVAGRSGSRLVFVAEPTAPAAVASDRIVMRPSSLQVTLVGDGRWVEAAPAHVRNLLVRSLANTGRYAFVTAGTIGPLPDFTLMTDIDAFEAQLLPQGSAAPARIVVSMTLSVVRDADGRLAASRRFSRTAEASGTDASAIVVAFQAANAALLREAVPWATTVMTGAPGV
jgi:cholesterol transport system auxiliary component